MQKLKYAFLWLTAPVQNLFSWLGHVFNAEPEMTEKHVEAIKAIVQPGDPLFSYEKGHPTNIFIPGPLDHSAIVAIHNNRLVVVEAIKPKVIKTPLEEWLYKKDRVVLGRLRGKNSEFREKAGAWALSQLGDSYDVMFRRFRRNSKNNKTYCSKLVANALRIFFTGELEPIELMENKKIEILYDTKKQ